MNIEINVSDITLATVVGEVVGFDEDGDAYPTGQRTVADMVAERIVKELVTDERYRSLKDLVLEIRKEEIRAAVRPPIDEALARPIYKTNTYGERTGTETTLAEIIADEARKQLAEPVDRYDTKKGTVLSLAVRAEVKKAFAAELADAVQQARDLVAKELSGELAAQVTKAITNGLRKA